MLATLDLFRKLRYLNNRFYGLILISLGPDFYGMICVTMLGPDFYGMISVTKLELAKVSNI